MLLISYQDTGQKGISYTICTDIEKDGMLMGPSTELYKEILKIEGINLIASGGITTREQIKELENIGCERRHNWKSLI